MIKITQVTRATLENISEVVHSIKEKTLIEVNGFEFYPKQARVDEHNNLYVEGFITEIKQ